MNFKSISVHFRGLKLEDFKELGSMSRAACMVGQVFVFNGPPTEKVTYCAGPVVVSKDNSRVTS